MEKNEEEQFFLNLLCIFFKVFCAHMKAKSLRSLLVSLKISKSYPFLPKTAIFWRPVNGKSSHETTAQEFNDETNLGKKRTVRL